MFPVVTHRTTRFQLFDNGVLRLFVGRNVVVLEQIRASAIDAGTVAVAHDALLPLGWVPAATRSVDRPAFGVVYERP